MESKRQLQIAELIKRNFSQVLLAEGGYIYDNALVTVTGVKISPDQSQAKIYLSVFNHDNKQEVMLLLYENLPHLRQVLAQRIRRHVRRIPELSFYLDDTLDEVQRLDQLFGRLHEEKQMGEEE